MVRPSRGSNDHVKMAVPSLVGEVKIVSPISAFLLNTLIKSFFFLVTQRAKQLNSSPGTGPQCYEFECLKDNYSVRRDVGLTQGSLIPKEHSLYRAYT